MKRQGGLLIAPVNRLCGERVRAAGIVRPGAAYLRFDALEVDPLEAPIRRLLLDFEGDYARLQRRRRGQQSESNNSEIDHLILIQRARASWTLPPGATTT